MNYSTPDNSFNNRIPYDEADLFDADEMVDELMAEGYSEEEALRMIGDYDPDEYREHDDDIPEMDDFDSRDFVDEEDFD
jgi:uncharacterized protein YoaH (UPF0181 family)